MKQLGACILSHLIHDTGHFPAKRTMVRRLGTLCDGAFLRTAYGVLLQSNLRDTTNFMAVYGRYGRQVADEVEKLNEGDAFIDIGANAGLFACLAAKAVGSSGVVICFEPQSDLYWQLQVNLSANAKHVNKLLFNCAVSAETRRISMTGVGAHHSGKAYISSDDPNGTWAVKIDSDLQLIRKAIDGRRTTIKIDVEGAEYDVLQGINDLLASRNVDTVVIEIDHNNLKRFKTDAEQIYELMNKYGFQAETSIADNKAHYDEIFRKYK